VYWDRLSPFLALPVDTITATVEFNPGRGGGGGGYGGAGCWWLRMFIFDVHQQHSHHFAANTFPTCEVAVPCSVSLQHGVLYGMARTRPSVHPPLP
jgi:hypothetical protein